MKMTQVINHVVAELEPFFERILATGSRVICSPPPEGTDEDYILLVKKDNLSKLIETLEARDWYMGGSMFVSPNKRHDLQEKHTFNQDGSVSNDNLFLSFKRQEDLGVINEIDEEDPDEELPEYLVEPSGPILNILVTCNQEYFDDFTRATYLAKSLNLTSKGDRVILFEALTRDKWPDPNKKQEPKVKKRSPFKDYLYSLSPGSVNTVPNLGQIFSTGTIGTGFDNIQSNTVIMVD